MTDQQAAIGLHVLKRLNLCGRLLWAAMASPAGMSRAARLSSERLPKPPNLLRRAVALPAGVASLVLNPVPLVELTEEAEGATEVVVLPTCVPTARHVSAVQLSTCSLAGSFDLLC